MLQAYDDEDNVPMNGIEDSDGHNPTVYGSEAEMRYMEKHGDELPFDDPGHDDGCWNCMEYNGEACMRDWKHADPDYYIPERDDKDPDDYCEAWREDKNAIWEDYH